MKELPQAEQDRREIIQRHREVAFHHGLNTGLAVGFLLGFSLAFGLWVLIR